MGADLGMSLFSKVSIVVVNYNNSQCTIDLINSLGNSWHLISKVVVVDNNSSDSELFLLNKIKHDKVTILYLSSNVGYFGGLNKGLELLVNDFDSPVIIGNNDLLFNDCFFSDLLLMHVKDNVMAIAPSLLTRDGIYQNPAQICKPTLFKRTFYSVYFSNYYVGVFIHKLWSILGFSAQSKIKKDFEAKPIYIGMGAAYVLLPSFFKRYKSLDYPFFLYGEEAFLSKQLEDAGGILWYEPSLEIVHLESVATAKMPTKEKYKLMRLSHSTYKNFFK